MQRIVIGVIDRLPPGPSMLVRSASVLGLRFPTRLLMKMVSASVATDTHTLVDLLQVLRRLNIVGIALGSGPEPSEMVWQ
eukprot:scaffold14390_cov35-Prasinocladus_malaysianus.AAC.1